MSGNTASPAPPALSAPSSSSAPTTSSTTNAPAARTAPATINVPPPPSKGPDGDKTPVTFQNNTIDAEKMKGGYFQWRLLGNPDSQIVNPATSVESSFTLKCNTIKCYHADMTTEKYELDVTSLKKEEDGDDDKVGVLIYPKNDYITLFGPDVTDDEDGEEGEKGKGTKTIITLAGKGGLTTHWVLKKDDK